MRHQNLVIVGMSSNDHNFLEQRMMFTEPSPIVIVAHTDVKAEDTEETTLDKPDLISLEETEWSDGLAEDFEQEKHHYLSSFGITNDNDPSYDSASSSDESYPEFTCKICKRDFEDDHNYQMHVRKRRIGDKQYKCCGCDKVFRDNSQLNVHARKHTGEQPYSCSICNKKFSVNGNLSKHMRIHTGERRFECDTCERKFTQLAHLEDHIKTHSGDRPYVCDFCNSSFKTKARLRKHKKSHEDERMTKRSVPCPICSKMMQSTKQLITHLETHDEGAQNPFPCSCCDKSYKNLFSLNIHMKSHGNIRDFQCTLCDKTFTNAGHLRRHSNSHSGIRPYTCNICFRGFPSQQNMKRHQMTHTGEKPHTCSECGKAFLTLENLTRHKRTHTGEKPFPCNICGKFFAHSTTAKEHLRVHTGEKNFKCEFCQKKFSLNKALYKHIREKHPKLFSEFKKKNDLPPNMRRALEKVKREAVNIDENEVKGVDTKIVMGSKFYGADEMKHLNRIEQGVNIDGIKPDPDEDFKMMNSVETRNIFVKEEPMEVRIKVEKEEEFS